jgi:segregation and condensation protein A|tara:strand:+ start:3052 stop:3930 length:879 start_codon:yes stop_codon:yes gene_type:complete
MEEVERVGQSQIHELLFGEKLSWQAIIYDLINTEQLDPWDIDISLLSGKYLEKVKEMEEANFFVSSKVLFAASLLLRMKSDIILNSDIPGLDDVLFGKKEEKKYTQERIELEDGEIPDLVPRTPIPRFKKVTLQELMAALGKAFKTENRRIRKEIVLKHHEREAERVMPKNTFNLKDKIGEIHGKLKNIFTNREERLAFSELVKISEDNKVSKEERVAAFVSLLHLDNQQKVWIEQENHLDEIWIMLKSLYEKQNSEKIEKLTAEIDKLYDDENDIAIENEAETNFNTTNPK